MLPRSDRHPRPRMRAGDPYAPGLFGERAAGWQNGAGPRRVLTHLEFMGPGLRLRRNRDDSAGGGRAQ